MIRTSLFALAMFAALPAAAQDDQDVSELDGGRSEGAVTVNVTSGNGNQQANVGVISLGPGNRINSVVRQYSDVATSSASSSVSLAADAYSGSSGWLALSVSAGDGNQHANLAIFAIGTEAWTASSTQLEQSRASIEPTGGPVATTGPERSVTVGDGALSDSRGLVQVSLVAGDGNTSANGFALTYDPGAASSGN